jgi:hypothetical protein
MNLIILYFHVSLIYHAFLGTFAYINSISQPFDFQFRDLEYFPKDLVIHTKSLQHISPPSGFVYQ